MSTMKKLCVILLLWSTFCVARDTRDVCLELLTVLENRVKSYKNDAMTIIKQVGIITKEKQEKVSWDEVCVLFNPWLQIQCEVLMLMEIIDMLGEDQEVILTKLEEIKSVSMRDFVDVESGFKLTGYADCFSDEELVTIAEEITSCFFDKKNQKWVYRQKNFFEKLENREIDWDTFFGKVTQMPLFQFLLEKILVDIFVKGLTSAGKFSESCAAKLILLDESI
jgi:hypothetical protein